MVQFCRISFMTGDMALRVGPPWALGRAKLRRLSGLRMNPSALRPPSFGKKPIVANTPLCEAWREARVKALVGRSKTHQVIRIYWLFFSWAGFGVIGRFDVSVQTAWSMADRTVSADCLCIWAGARHEPNSARALLRFYRTRGAGSFQEATADI